MNQKIVHVKTKSPASSYDVRIGDGLLVGCGDWAKHLLKNEKCRIAVISNRKVFGLYGKTVEESLQKSGFKVNVHLVGDGERFKNFRTLEGILKFLAGNKFTRTDAVLALGGGVVGDVGGFAASVYLRGIAFLQVPTTLLAMIDSSTGGKTGVNTAFGKNLVGSFYQPAGVLIDSDTLKTLPGREITAGFCEAIKQGAISGRKLFNQTSAFLEKRGSGELEIGFELNVLIVEHISFKARIVEGDERESVAKKGPKSRKILNFGHTFAHALEKVTDYRLLKHGEAVGYGIIFAAELSKKLGLLKPDEVNLLNGVVHRAGSLPGISHIDPAEVLEAFKYDKKITGDKLNWILLEKIGKPIIVPHTSIPQSAIMTTLKKVIKK